MNSIQQNWFFGSLVESLPLRQNLEIKADVSGTFATISKISRSITGHLTIGKFGTLLLGKHVRSNDYQGKNKRSRTLWWRHFSIQNYNTKGLMPYNLFEIYNKNLFEIYNFRIVGPLAIHWQSFYGSRFELEPPCFCGWNNIISYYL